MTDISLYQLALYDTTPKIGDINPPGEVSYEGYGRIQAAVIDNVVYEKCVFPKCKSGEPVRITHIALLTFSGRVVEVQEVTDENIF